MINKIHQEPGSFQRRGSIRSINAKRMFYSSNMIIFVRFLLESSNYRLITWGDVEHDWRLVSLLGETLALSALELDEDPGAVAV